MASVAPSPADATSGDPLLLLEQAVHLDGLETGVAILESVGTENPKQAASLWLRLIELAEVSDPNRALEIGLRAFDLLPNATVARKVGRIARALGDVVLAEQLIRYRVRQHGKNAPLAADLKYLAIVQGWKRLYLDGYKLPARSAVPLLDTIPNTSIYFLHNTLPYSSAGYAVRSHGLLQAINNNGMSTVAYSRLGFPADLSNFGDSGKKQHIWDEDEIDGVTYRRLHAIHTGYSQLPIDTYLDVYAERIIEVARREQPSIIHAASNWINGLPAVAAGRALGIPTLYEVRGLWEVTRLSRDPAWENSQEHQTYVRMEAQAATGADFVIAITNALREEFIRRGVAPERITVVPNGVDPHRFVPGAPDVELANELQLSGHIVIGYIGSFVQYEGLDDLLHACRLMVNRGVDFRLLLVGDGKEWEKIRTLVSELDLSDVTVITGRVPHAMVNNYYSLVDVAPFPRKPLQVTEMVSPLKPFEAMALEKAVLVSSVQALAEIVQDGATGIIYEKGNVADLAAKLELLVTDAQLRERLGKEARRWVLQNRSWDSVGRAVADVYRHLQEEARARADSRAPRSFLLTHLPGTLRLDIEVHALAERLSKLERQAAVNAASSPGSETPLTGGKGNGRLSPKAGIFDHAESWVPVEELGQPRPYRPTFGTNLYVNEEHESLSKCQLTRGVLIDIGIPGALRREDALKLYELAYAASGDVLELGCGHGLSTSIIVSGVLASGTGRKVVSVDRNNRLIDEARRNLQKKKRRDIVQFMCSEAHLASQELSDDGRKFGLVFVDDSTSHQDALAVVRHLPRLVKVGGFVLFHDFNDRRNMDSTSTGYGVFDAVQQGLSPTQFAFHGVFGCTALYRRVAK